MLYYHHSLTYDAEKINTNFRLGFDILSKLRSGAEVPTKLKNAKEEINDNI